MENNDKDVFINVPQGCYGVINETTPQNIKGLLTTDLNICTCIIVMDKSHKNMVLAHVDGNHTNLLDPECGLLHWLELIPGDEVEIEIYYGKKQNKNTDQNNLYNSIYEEQINFINKLMKKHNINKNITIIPVEHKHGYGSGACILRRSRYDNNNETNGIFYGSNSGIIAAAEKMCEKDNKSESKEDNESKCIIEFEEIKKSMSEEFIKNESGLIFKNDYSEMTASSEENVDNLFLYNYGYFQKKSR